MKTPGFGHHVTVTDLPGEAASPPTERSCKSKSFAVIDMCQEQPVPVDFNNPDSTRVYQGQQLPRASEPNSAAAGLHALLR